MYIKKFSKTSKYIKPIKIDVTKFKISDDPVLPKCVDVMKVSKNISSERRKHSYLNTNVHNPFGSLKISYKAGNEIEKLYKDKNSLNTSDICQAARITNCGRNTIIGNTIVSIGNPWEYIQSRILITNNNKLGINFEYLGNGVALINIKNKELRHLNVYTQEERIFPKNIIDELNGKSILNIKKTYITYVNKTEFAKKAKRINNYFYNNGFDIGKKFKIYRFSDNGCVILRLKDLKMLTISVKDLQKFIYLGEAASVSFKHCNHDYILVNSGYFWNNSLSNHMRRTSYLNFAVFHITDKGMLYICNVQLGSMFNQIAAGYISFLDYIVVNGSKYKPYNLIFDNKGIHTKSKDGVFTIYDSKKGTICVKKLPVFPSCKNYRTSLKKI